MCIRDRLPAVTVCDRSCSHSCHLFRGGNAHAEAPGREMPGTPTEHPPKAKPAKEGRMRLQMGGEKGGMANMRRELCPPGVRQSRGGVLAAHREHAPHWPLPA
eukprot:603756-Rhodomonas_salina.1